MSDLHNRWNDRWRKKAAVADFNADPWLQKIHPLLPRGKAIDIACGMGRNAVFLAEQGFAVTAVDVSEVALDLLDAEARRRDLVIETVPLDLETDAQLPAGPFDLLLNFFYLHRPLLAQELARVRPGGVIVLRTFSSAGADRYGPISPEISLRAGELLEIFTDWEILLHEEGIEPSAKGGSLAGIVARRPD